MNLIVLERIEPKQNCARFYVLSIEQSLFREIALTRRWGRIGKPGRQRIDLHSTAAEARESLDAWLARKLKRGYVLR